MQFRINFIIVASARFWYFV